MKQVYEYYRRMVWELKSMVYTTGTLKFGKYLEGNFLYHANQRLRKVLPKPKAGLCKVFSLGIPQ